MFNFLKYFPKEISDLISLYSIEGLEEIRLRVNRQIILKYMSQEIVLDYKVNQEQILKILQFICDNSIYSYQNQICNGYITITGGHRVRHNWGSSSRK